MVILKNIRNKLFIALGDRLLQYNFEDDFARTLKIPEPILPENLTKGQIEVLKKEIRTITSVAFSKDAEYIAISTENKQVIVCDNTFNIIKNTIVNRAASKLCFTPTNDILIADKTGDVFLYPFKKDDCQITLLLGHLSVILDLLVSDCGKYVITCDRDEKIRVSCYPNAYNIASFCLGHKEFVTNIKLIKNMLISASGDGTIRFWNYLNGEQLGLINTSDRFDQRILKKFSDQMDVEKVDVLTLPITDLQVCNVENYVLIAISLYGCDSVFVYQLDQQSFSSNFLTSIPANSNDFSFCFSNKNLYILSDKFYNYQLIGSKFVGQKSEKLESLFEKHKLLKISEESNITALYKRKFDNVQEYLERKKQRLELKI